ncbi:hypothetical protein I4000191A8_12930 [Clostridia bacterium i40-0019-1A8]
MARSIAWIPMLVSESRQSSASGGEHLRPMRAFPPFFRWPKAGDRDAFHGGFPPLPLKGEGIETAPFLRHTPLLPPQPYAGPLRALCIPSL